MFITNKAHRAALLGLFAGEGDAYWRVVEKVLLKPWYLVTLRQSDGEKSSALGSEVGFEFTRSIFISEMRDLMSLLELANSAAYSQTLESVMVVTPGHMNGSGDWQMDRVTAIWQTTNTEEQDELKRGPLVLETTKGKHYATSSIEDIDNCHGDLSLVYRMPAPRT